MGPASYVPLGCVLVALLFVYAPVREAQFLQWDDFRTIAANPDLNPPTAKSVLRYWDPARPYMDLYVPVTYTAWAAVASMPGAAVSPAPSRPAPGPRLDPAAFHTASLLVHAACAVFAFLILRRLLASNGVAEDRSAWAAGVGAALFALHPLQVESVAWASGLKDVLAGALTLAALWLYLIFAEPGASRGDGLFDSHSSPASLVSRFLGAVRRALASPAFVLATLAFVLAMLSKPSAVVTPILAACLALVLPAGREDGASAGTPDTTRRPPLRARLFALRPVLTPLALWVLLALPIMGIARQAQPAASGFDSPLWARPLVAADALAFYAAKLVAPVRLAMDYGRSPDSLAATPWIWCTWIVPAAIAAAVLLARKRAPWLVPAALFSVAALGTVLGLVRFDFQSHSTVADHYVYVALLGPALALALLLAGRSTDRILVIGGLLLIPLGSIARAQVFVWHDTVSLFTHTLDVNPRSVAAHINLGHVLYTQGRTEEAMRHDEAALETRPHEPEAHNNLGNALLRLKRPREAAEHFRAALAVQPGSVSAHFNLGLALADLGDIAGAKREYEEALRLAPQHAGALTNLAEIELNAGNYDKAADGYRRALAINPNLAPARRGLANALAGQRGSGGAGATADSAGSGESGESGDTGSESSGAAGSSDG
jgi:tetratricopeptide (TPR) repeat protein